jgi:hypothetical protein
MTFRTSVVKLNVAVWEMGGREAADGCKVTVNVSKSG